MAEFISQPKDPLLPFIAYGSFKPNELRYNQIKDFVDSCEKIEIMGEILDKDGIPIFVRESKNTVYYPYQAFVITFKKGREEEAYEIICKNEPQTYYQWEVWDNRNLLTGKRHLRGACNYDKYSWKVNGLNLSSVFAGSALLFSERYIDWIHMTPVANKKIAERLIRHVLLNEI